MNLTWLVLIPFVGGLLAWQSERFGRSLPRIVSLLSMAGVLGVAGWMWCQGDFSLARDAAQATVWQAEVKYPWIERFGIEFHLGADGLSLAMIMLTGFIGMLAVGCSWTEVRERVGAFHLNLMLVLGAVVGVFLALDLFLFFIFWELMLVPMVLLIALWGHNGASGNRKAAALKFFIFTQASGLLLLLAIILLVFAHYQVASELTFDYNKLLGTALPFEVEMALMLGFFIAFAVKLPIVPFHGWLPDAHAHAPTAGSVDLAGLLVKAAAYGMLRFCLPLFPNACAEFAPIAMWIGIIGIVYGAFLAFAQTDIKRLIAYSSISHMGYVLIGIFAGTTMALQGVVVQMVAHAFSAAALFIICGQLQERLGTRDMREMGGLWARLPWLPPITLFFAAASLGLPGTGNFVGEFLILQGSFKAAPWVVAIATAGLVLASAYCLALVHRSFYGPAKSEAPVRGPSVREFGMLAALVAGLVAIGLYPQPIIDSSAAASSRVNHVYSAALQAAQKATP